MIVTYLRERTYIVQKALFASSTTLHLGDDDSALEGWRITLTFADGKHGNVALLATGGKSCVEESPLDKSPFSGLASRQKQVAA